MDTQSKPRKKVHKSLWIILLAMGGLMMLAGVSIIAIFFIPENSLPPTIKEEVKKIQTEISKTVDEASNRGEMAITVGHIGGAAELELCDGTFTQVISYEEGGLQPTFLAHNGCGGSPVLYAELGSIVKVTSIEGVTKEYKVVSERILPQIGSYASDVVGLEGDILLQTCYWDWETMRFIGLESLEEKKTDKAPEPNTPDRGDGRELELLTPNKSE